MIRIEPPEISRIKRGDEGTCEDVKKLSSINDILNNGDGKCYIEILEGDYKGSIAIFTQLDYDAVEDVVDYRTLSSTYYNLKSYWSGRLSWQGKRNNPSFLLRNGSAIVLPEYSGNTVFKKRNLKAEAEKLLSSAKPADIDGYDIEIGDKVLYMNLRYGSGGILSKGIVKNFKAHARDGYVSVIVENSDVKGEESQLHYPHRQIFKFLRVNDK